MTEPATNMTLASNPEEKRHRFLLVAILTLATFLNFYNLKFEVGYHADEKKKGNFVINVKSPDFRHPILMIQLVKGLNKIFSIPSRNKVVIVGRSLSAIAGVLAVFFTYRLTLMFLSRRYALFAAFSVAVCPMVVIHAHYFKEDIYLTACGLFSLICFFNFLRKKTLSSNILWGLSMGLVNASKYSGGLLIITYLFYPLLAWDVDKKWFYASFLKAFVVALSVFCLINYPMFYDLDHFSKGVGFESLHVTKGHAIRFHPLPNWFSFHLLSSIIPGISLSMTLLAAGGMTHTVFRWKKAPVEVRFLLLFAVVFYLVHEYLPMKAHPNFMRYMVPMGPLLLIFSCLAVQRFEEWIKDSFQLQRPQRIGASLMILVNLWPLYNTSMLDYYLANDTRAKAAHWFSAAQQKTIVGKYAVLDQEILYFPDLDIPELLENGVVYVGVSSFIYGRYLKGAKLPKQKLNVYERAKIYHRLFSLPYVEIKPDHRTFAFSNPVIRFVDIRGWADVESDPEKP